MHLKSSKTTWTGSKLPRIKTKDLKEVRNKCKLAKSLSIAISIDDTLLWIWPFNRQRWKSLQSPLLRQRSRPIGVDNAFSVLNASGLTFPFMLVRINRSINHLSVRRIRMAWMVCWQPYPAPIHYSTGTTIRRWFCSHFSQPSDISIIALGPLTNIAMRSSESDLGRHCTHISIGGPISHSNCSPVAEFNYWSDPDAALLVFDQLDQKIEMVGLDVTREIVFTPTLLAYCQRVNLKRRLSQSHHPVLFWFSLAI